MTNTAGASTDPWISMCFHRSGVIPPTLGHTESVCKKRGKMLCLPLSISSLMALRACFVRTNHLQFGPVIFPRKILVACEIRWSAFLHARSLISWMGGMAGMTIGWNPSSFLFFSLFFYFSFVSILVRMTSVGDFYEIKLKFPIFSSQISGTANEKKFR